MTERWAKPVVPLGVEEAGKMLVYAGRVWNVPCYILDADSVERVRLGYVCLNCLEQHEQNHPPLCQVCHFPIREIQDDVFEQMYEGEVRIGPSTSLGEEMDIAEEMIKRGGKNAA